MQFSPDNQSILVAFKLSYEMIIHGILFFYSIKASTTSATVILLLPLLHLMKLHSTHIHRHVHTVSIYVYRLSEPIKMDCLKGYRQSYIDQKRQNKTKHRTHHFVLLQPSQPFMFNEKKDRENVSKDDIWKHGNDPTALPLTNTVMQTFQDSDNFKVIELKKKNNTQKTI